jgi:hypothetical protein
MSRQQAPQAILGGIGAIGVGLGFLLLPEFGWLLPAFIIGVGVLYLGFGIHAVLPQKVEPDHNARPQDVARGIDRRARVQLHDALALLVECKMDSWTFDELGSSQWRRSRDRAVKAIAGYAWFLYPTAAEAAGPFPRVGVFAEIDGERQRTVERCRLYLQSDLAYRWPNAAGAHLWDIPLYFACAGGVIYGVVMAISGLEEATKTGAQALWSCVAGILIWAAVAVVIVLRGWWWRLEEKRFLQAGDRDFWPFLNRVQYDQVSGMNGQ